MARIVFPTVGVSTRVDATLLALDDYLVPFKNNLCYYLTEPTVRPEPVLEPSRENPNAPDHLAAHFYGTVLREAGEYRMWYYGIHFGDNPGPLNEGPVCYARSADGIEWEKPPLGQVEHAASTANNAIRLPDARTEGVEILREDDDPDPMRRYKMVYETFSDPHMPTIRTATSPDGIHWDASPGYPVPLRIEQSSFYRYGGMYYVNGQMWPKGEGSRSRGRQGHVVVSPDFNTWLPACAESFALPEPEEAGNGVASDQVHLGVGAVSLGTVLVGLYCRWHARPNPGDWFGRTTTSGDLGLVLSNDGIHFREPIKGRLFLTGEQSPVTPIPGKPYPTILEQAHGILTVEDETRIYHGRWRNAPVGEEYYAEVALATIPRDRWGALGLVADEAEGSAWTAPFVLPADGCRLAVNADVPEGISIALVDDRFVPIGRPASVRRSAADGLEHPVDLDLSRASLGGRSVRLRIDFRRYGNREPRLYAAYLRKRAP